MKRIIYILLPIVFLNFQNCSKKTESEKNNKSCQSGQTSEAVLYYNHLNIFFNTPIPIKIRVEIDNKIVLDDCGNRNLAVEGTSPREVLTQSFPSPNGDSTFNIGNVRVFEIINCEVMSLNQRIFKENVNVHLVDVFKDDCDGNPEYIISKYNEEIIE